MGLKWHGEKLKDGENLTVKLRTKLSGWWQQARRRLTKVVFYTQEADLGDFYGWEQVFSRRK